MYDYESMRRAVIDQARQHYTTWQRYSEGHDVMRAMEYMHKYQAVAALAVELFDIPEDELTGKRPGPLERYAQK